MRHKSLVILSVMLLTGVVFSCKKWEDPAPTDHPEINTPYCNDPDAVNYNWDFPGKPDNTVCFYPSDLFAGTYYFRDSAYRAESDLFLAADSMEITITKVNSKQISVAGLCHPGGELHMTALAAYMASVDTTVGDSLSGRYGQFFCRPQDTVTGSFSRDKVDSSLIYITFTVFSDTGATVHTGRAIKK